MLFYKRSKSNQHVLKLDEVVDAFTDWWKCNYGELTDEMILHQIVVGIHNNVAAGPRIDTGKGTETMKQLNYNKLL